MWEDIALEIECVMEIINGENGRLRVGGKYSQIFEKEKGSPGEIQMKITSILDIIHTY
jgi:hypothetical protein